MTEYIDKKSVTDWLKVQKRSLTSSIQSLGDFGQSVEIVALDKVADFIKSLPAFVECTDKCINYSDGYGCSISPMMKCETCANRPHAYLRPTQEDKPKDIREV